MLLYFIKTNLINFSLHLKPQFKKQISRFISYLIFQKLPKIYFDHLNASNFIHINKIVFLYKICIIELTKKNDLNQHILFTQKRALNSNNFYTIQNYLIT
jgi:hypothetical protein